MTDLSHPPQASARLAKPRARRAEPPINHRATLVRWLRKTHGWFGLWGAVIGLVFGVSGIWLNHRAVLKLPVPQQKTAAQIALPEPPPATPDTLGAWLQQALDAPEPAYRVRVEKTKPVPWAAHANQTQSDGAATERLMQPEQWVFSFGGASTQLHAEYWAGNRSVSIRQTDNGLLGTLMNLHKGVGMTVPWILLVDTLAGCLIFLSISGLWLWVLTTRQRTVGWTIFGLGSLLTIGLAASRF